MIPVMTGATFGSCLIPALSAGAGFLMPGRGKYIPPDDRSPTFVMGNPTHFARALATERAWRAVDRGWRGTVAGAPIPPGLAERVFDRLGGALYPHYGMTETLAATSARRPLDDTVGKPLPGVDIRIVATDGRRVAAGGEGEVQLKSPARFIRYMTDGAGTDEGSEWFATGDVGSLDPWGNLRLTGRVKNVIIRCGNVVYPEEIERAAAECDDVAECAAVGRPRSEIGEEILLLVVWKNRGNENEEGVRRELAAWAPPYRMPDRIVTVAALPRADSGKIDRERLKIEVRDV
jgi:acyl-CoA synthetase (AMP-forming)/AMP-acid ligase II